MDVYAQFATDETKELEGVWVDLDENGARIRVARAGNRKYSRMLSREIEKHQRALDAKTEAADELSERIMIDVMAHTILLGWEGLKFKGEPLPYSVENARKLLSVKDFRQFVTKCSNDFEAYRVAQETELGNS